MSTIHFEDCVAVDDSTGCEGEIYCSEAVRWKIPIEAVVISETGIRAYAYLCDWHRDKLPSVMNCECKTCADDMEDDMEAERRAFSKQRRIER